MKKIGPVVEPSEVVVEGVASAAWTDEQEKQLLLAFHRIHLRKGLVAAQRRRFALPASVRLALWLCVSNDHVLPFLSCRSQLRVWDRSEQRRGRRKRGKEKKKEKRLFADLHASCLSHSLGGMCDIEPIMALKPPGIPGGGAPYGEGAP